MIPEPSTQADIQVLVAASGLADRLAIQKVLDEMGLHVTAAPDMDTALQLCARNRFRLILMVHDPEGMDGIEFLKAAAPADGGASSVVLLSDKAHLEDAVRAMELGASDFRCRPWDGTILELIVKRALSSPSMAPSSTQMDSAQGQGPSGCRRTSSASDTSRYRILTKSPQMDQVLKKAKMVARSKAPVLIQGESGTGKELLARFIHMESDRAEGPFVALNCAALPETLLESELFGHEKGAFSGALTRKAGKFELADGGTILLDEITEMALPLQAKLLRVLQESEVDRLGGTEPVRVDVRVVATTNRDVLAAVQKGQFREDLYFRLNVIPLRLPPLRERQDDVLYLAHEFLKEFSELYGKNGLEFASDVVEFLERHHWPGNVRELRNMVERGVLLAQGKKITMEEMMAAGADSLGEAEIFAAAGGANRPGHSSDGAPESFNLSDMEREMVKKALSKTGGNRTHAAKLLGISVRTLRNKLSEYRKMGLVL